MGQKKKSEGQNNKDENPMTVVLKVDMHCEGCASKIVRCLRAFKGVETVKAESDTGKITLTGQVEPTKVREKLAEKMKKKVELLSPQGQPKKEKENKPDNKTDEKKPKEPPVTTAVLKVALHCQGCVDRITKTILKTKGVHTMSIDKEKDTVTVKGTMDAKALAENLMEKLKRKVEVVPPKKDKDNDKEGGGGDKDGGSKKKNKGGNGDGGGNNNDNKEVEGGGKMGQGKMEYLPPPAFGFAYGNVGGYNYVPLYPEHYFHLHAPQMFSDENPNACSLM